MKHLTRLVRHALVGMILIGAAAPGAIAQSIRVTDSEKVLHGSASQCLKAAVVDYKKLREATPEYKQIRKQAIEKGTAQYEILSQQITTRIRDLLRDYCKTKGYDCVVVKGYVKPEDASKATDITDEVLEKLEEELGR